MQSISKNQILEELYNTEFVDKYIYKLSNSLDLALIDDIKGEIWVIICEIKEDRIISLYKQGGINKVRQFVSGIIYRQIRSKTSPIYKKYKKWALDNIATDDFSSLLDNGRYE